MYNQYIIAYLNWRIMILRMTEVRLENCSVKRGWNGTFGVEEGKIQLATVTK